jgi:hypothetical protein
MQNVAALLRRRMTAVAAGAVLVVAGLVWFCWPARDSPAAQPAVNNVAGNYRACLLSLTGDRAGASTTALVWKGLQKAAGGGRVNAQRIPVPAADVASATPYVNGAIGQGCDVVVVADQALLPAVRAAARKTQTGRFLVVGVGPGLPNVESVADADLINAWVLERAVA